jgi:hypothetical protein
MDGGALAAYKKFYINLPTLVAVALRRGQWKQECAEKALAT